MTTFSLPLSIEAKKSKKEKLTRTGLADLPVEAEVQ